MLFPLEQFEQALLSIDRVKALDILNRLIGSLTPLEIAEGLIVPVLERIGEAWEKGDVALAQVYMSGRICEEYVEFILPLTRKEEIKKPTIAIAVLEDYHKLGKRVVKAMLHAAGYSILDYETISLEELVKNTLRDKIQILLISTLMLPSALRIKELSSKIKKQSPSTKIVVGGAPFRYDSRLWLEVGAHAVGYNAAEAVSIVSRLGNRVKS